MATLVNVILRYLLENRKSQLILSVALRQAMKIEDENKRHGCDFRVFVGKWERGVPGIYKSTMPPFGGTVRFVLELVKQTTPGLAW